MGVQITELLQGKEISVEQLHGKVLSVDAPNHLYQFLSTIRQRDGSLFTDSNGNVTSHLIGLLSRTTSLLKSGLKLVYVFDGKVPDLKRAEVRRRADVKAVALEKFKQAEESGNVEDMKRYAARTSRLTPEMILEAKRLLDALGVPYLVAPSEGEAQAAYMAKKNDCYAVASQDADCLLFQAPLLLRNLSITGRKKLTGKLGFQQINPEMFNLKDNLANLSLNQAQFISLAMLVGTDYNSGGIKGIGPKKALALVKAHSTPEKIFAAAKWSEFFTVSWQEVYETIAKMHVTDDYEIKFSSPKKEALMKLLCEEHGFASERVQKAVDDLCSVKGSSGQKGLMDFS